MSAKKKYSSVLVVLIVILLILVFFEPAYGWRVRQWIRAHTSENTQQAQGENPSLAAQNEALQAELAEMQSVAAQLPQNPEDQIRAMVAAQYPFGFRKALLINAGTNEGVQIGKAATFEGDVVGMVAQVFPDSALIQTVFDPSLKMPVLIGDSNGNVPRVGVDALLIGGASPQATSITKNASLMAGDIVYTAAPGLPYGLPVGVISAIGMSPDDLFQKVTLNFVYDVSDIQTVLISR